MVALRVFGILALITLTTVAGCKKTDASDAKKTEKLPPDASIREARVTSQPKPTSSPSETKLNWFLSVLNQEKPVDAKAMAAHFSPAFLAKVPPEKLGALTEQIRAAKPFTLERIEERRPESLTALVSGTGSTFRIRLSVGPEKPHRIHALLIQPASAVPEPKSWADAETRLAKLGEKTSLYAAKIEQGACSETRAFGSKEAMGVGSAFKLYVLLALAEDIAAGKQKWDTPLAIRQEWKSLPSGTMQNLEVGTTRPIREYAEKMISISDNTATDHLLYTLGRERVEKAMSQSGHNKPELNTPFLSTREFFALKLGMTLSHKYRKMPSGQRRAFVEKELKGVVPSLLAAGLWTKPTFIEEIEWFATGPDLCAVMAKLQQAGQKDPIVLDVLSKNPGIPQATRHWALVGFKGGSEVGVLNFTWLLRSKSGAWHFLSLGINNTKTEVDMPEAISIATGALELLSKD